MLVKQVAERAKQGLQGNKIMRGIAQFVECLRRVLWVRIPPIEQLFFSKKRAVLGAGVLLLGGHLLDLNLVVIFILEHRCTTI